MGSELKVAIAVKSIELGDHMIATRSASRSASERDPMQTENFRGEIFVGITRGMKYAEKMANESKSLESRLSALKESYQNLSSHLRGLTSHLRDLTSHFRDPRISSSKGST